MSPLAAHPFLGRRHASSKVHWSLPFGLIAAAAFFLSAPALWYAEPIEKSYGTFRELVREGQIETVLVWEDRVFGALIYPIQPKQNAAASRHVVTRLPKSRHHLLRSFLAEHGLALTSGGLQRGSALPSLRHNRKPEKQESIENPR